MTDLKRTIAGVAIHADTTDLEKVEKVKRTLDEAMRLLQREKDMSRFARKLIETIAQSR